MTWPYGSFGRDCKVCGRRKRQANWSRLATCGRACGLAWKTERLAAARPDHLRSKLGPMTAREREIYRKAYAAGYARGWYRGRYVVGGMSMWRASA